MSLCVRDVMVPRVQLIEATTSAKNSARMMDKFGVGHALCFPDLFDDVSRSSMR